jgi:hypothetical protein
MDALVTVFRSADPSASEDAANIAQLLKDEGIESTVVTDDEPGVPEGAVEVRVSPADQARAEQLVAEENPDEELNDVDPSADLDLVNVFEGGGNVSEMEAQAVKSLLEANGIGAVLIGDSRLPNVMDEVRVAREQLPKAQQLIAEALAAGPAAAEEAEKSFE